jgi:hypothetical protein
MEEQPNSGSHPVLRWGALALGTLICGGGVAAMYGDDYKVAALLYLVGIIIIAADFITLDGHDGYRGSKWVVLVGGTTFVAAFAFALSLAWIHLRKADIQAGQVPPQSEQPKPENPVPVPTQRQTPKEPSFVYVVPGVWLNNSTWDLIVRHHGPNPVNNIEIVFDDQDRHKEAARTGTPFNVNDIMKTLHFDEIDAVEGVMAKQFPWTPLDPNSSTFSIAVTSRQGRVDETLKIVGHDGKDWQFAIKVSDGLSKNVLLHCRDPKLPASVEFPERLPRCFPDYTVGPAKSEPKAAQHTAARTSGPNSPAVGSIQQGPGSALSVGQQGGITAGTVNLGPPPLKLQYSFHTLAANETPTFGFDRTKCPVVSHIRIIPNQSVPPPISVALDFDQPVTEIATTIEGVSGLIGGGPFSIGFHAISSPISSPGIGPHHPLIVEVCSNISVSLKGEPHLVN